MYRKNVWVEKSDKHQEIMNFAEGYKAFLDQGKTERECVEYTLKELKKQGYQDLNKVKTLKAGDKVYVTNHDKNVFAFLVGKKPLNEGLRILGAHIDSPRLDLKQNPLYEKEGFVYLDTHYYGGIKKYQWVTTPLAIHGVVVHKNGKKTSISIGEDDKDPVFGVSDLLIHLSGEQMSKPAHKVIEGENLDITFGNIPLKDEKKDAVKGYILKLLKEKYKIEEEDFVSSELEVVPAFKAKDYGLDCSMVAAYGQDDRSCAYLCLKAFLDTNKPEYTSALFLVDKEEIGSVGATGAESRFFVNSIAKLAEKLGEKDPYFYALKAIESSKALSCDVSAAHDPLYAFADDTKNGCSFGHGVTFNKFTGRGGKGGSNDADAEYMGYIRKLMDDNNICYQTAELGKVDQGGGGTIAFIFANHNMDVIDAGVGVLNMHSPFEITSKADLYEGYNAFKAFLGDK